MLLLYFSPPFNSSRPRTRYIYVPLDVNSAHQGGLSKNFGDFICFRETDAPGETG